MLNTITQILLGIIYGLYLAFLAPACQRQKAHDWLKQQAITPKIQPKPKQPQIFSPVIESTPKFVANTNIAEDSRTAQSTSAATENQENPTAIAIKKQLPTATIAQLDPNQSAKTHTTKPKQSVAQVQHKEVVPTELAFRTVAQLRSLCKKRNIKWRNAGDGKHLTKKEMLERLCA